MPTISEHPLKDLIVTAFRNLRGRAPSVSHSRFSSAGVRRSPTRAMIWFSNWPWLPVATGQRIQQDQEVG
jgi:hypothetical protein